MQKQKTLKKEVSLKGTGIHTGEQVNITFKPALPNSSINFLRTDLPDSPLMPATLAHLLDAQLRVRRTSIGKDKAQAHTIEHLMAVFCGLGIDNILVEMDGPEAPGLDGSAAKIVEVIKTAGLMEQDAPRKELLIKDPLWVDEKDSCVVVLPSDHFSVSYILDYSHAGIEPQYNHFRIIPEIFEKEIAPSRTFCLKEEIDSLTRLGLGKGASPKNTIIIDSDGRTTADLRFKDEFLRHKVMDLIGDLFLTGYFLKAHIIAIKSGHSLNLKIAQAVKSRYIDNGNTKTNRTAASGEKPLMDKEAIKGVLPHREPFLLIDEIIELGELTAVGVKHVDDSEYYFRGHFPGRPVMPGVLIVEALAQVGGALMLSKPENKGKLAYFMSINSAKFRRVVKPGDKLRLEIEVTRFRTKVGQVHGKAFVDGQLVCEADLMFSLVD
ncbi:MAG: UDP-3-O-acyl-N-acetylglucosamine deacetylase [Candidatus Omnitrophota bacterium]